MDKQLLNELIINCVKQVLEEVASGHTTNINSESKLYSSGGLLDSLSLVRLIADIEEEIYQKTNQTITLADEKAMSQRNSPFKSIISLSDYIEKLLTE
ncbi:MAG TPA: hypothetical protein PK796_08200 [Bacteroidales bacterium]|jgi:acyl carrier protein|nr:hypothetical protein [Bacteroidales bacterium]